MAADPTSTVIFISDNQSEIHRARQWSHDHGYSIKTFTSLQWQNGLSNPIFRSMLFANPDSQKRQASNVGQVVSFPETLKQSKASPSTSTIKEVEKLAIQEAICVFQGNLTKTALSLGIGRATLYRKVKLYNIDLSNMRSRRKIKALKAA